MSGLERLSQVLVAIGREVRGGSGHQQVFTHLWWNDECQILGGVKKVEVQTSLERMFGNVTDLARMDLSEKCLG